MTLIQWGAKKMELQLLPDSLPRVRDLQEGGCSRTMMTRTTSSVGGAQSLTLVSVFKQLTHCSGNLTPHFSAFRSPSLSAGPTKTKTSVDLFADDDDDDEDGDIFSEKFSAPAQSKKDVEVKSSQNPEKKVKLA